LPYFAWLLALSGSLLLLSACQKHDSKASSGTDLVRRYIALAVELGERDPDSLDFAINTDRSLDRFKSNPEAFDGLHRSALALGDEIRNLPDGDPAFTA